MRLEIKIEIGIRACELETSKPNASGYLGDIITSLETILKVLRGGGEPLESRHRRASGLFRIISEDAELLASPLGKQLVDLANEYSD